MGAIARRGDGAAVEKLQQRTACRLNHLLFIYVSFTFHLLFTHFVSLPLTSSHFLSLSVNPNLLHTQEKLEIVQD